MNKHSCIVLSLCLLMATSTLAQKKPAAKPADQKVVADLDQRLAKYQRVQMPFHSEGLTAREKKMVAKLVEASLYLEDIFWRQNDPEALDLYQSLAGSNDPKAIATLFRRVDDDSNLHANRLSGTRLRRVYPGRPSLLPGLPPAFLAHRHRPRIPPRNQGLRRQGGPMQQTDEAPVARAAERHGSLAGPPARTLCREKP